MHIWRNKKYKHSAKNIIALVPFYRWKLYHSIFHLEEALKKKKDRGALEAQSAQRTPQPEAFSHIR